LNSPRKLYAQFDLSSLTYCRITIKGVAHFTKGDVATYSLAFQPEGWMDDNTYAEVKTL
jgi:hypothetical protein